MKRHTGDEQGALAVIVAILLVVLLGAAALAVDVGLMYAEKAQLQNGADAAALGVAQICAEDITDSGCAPDSFAAASLAKSNANDDQSNIEKLVIEKDAGQVRADVNAQEAGQGPGEISLFFARVFGVESTFISAKSAARWGGPSGGDPPFAIAFSQCEIDASPTHDGSLQFLRTHGTGTEDKACTSTSSGQELPGGFGWIQQQPSESCTMEVDLDSPWVASDEGQNFKMGCEQVLAEWKKALLSGESVITLLPVFDKTDAGKYRLEAFAAFDVRAWHFYKNGDGFGSFSTPEAQSYMPKSGNSETGIIGRFIRHVALDNTMDVGGPSKYGAKVVALTE